MPYPKPFNFDFRVTSGSFGIGVIFPKGFWLHYGNSLLISKDGIYYLFDNEFYSIELCLLLRFLAIIDTLFFILSLPAMIIIYPIMLIFSLLMLIIAFPIFLPLIIWKKVSYNDNYIREKLLRIYFCFWVGFVCPTISLLVIIGLTLLTPFYIIVPELCVKYLKIHKWGPSV